MSAVAGRAANEPTLPIPTPAQQRWQDHELGIVFHYDSHVFMPGGHHHERSRRDVVPAELYRPDKLDTDQWLAAAQAAGAGYCILTATHHQGFLQWPSDLYDYGVKQAPWRDGKGDLVGDFLASCAKVGMPAGLYLGIRFNAYQHAYQYQVEGGDEAAQQDYLRLCEAMVAEVCGRYGPLTEVWFDGGVPTPDQGGPDVLPIVASTRPEAVFYHTPARADHRWAGSETGTTGDPCWATLPSPMAQYAAHRGGPQVLAHGDPDGAIWSPAMADAPLRNHYWAWTPNTVDKLEPVDRLIAMYEQSVGRNANLILGAVPNLDGLLDDAEVARMTELGDEIGKRYGMPLAEASGSALVQLPEAMSIGSAILMEDIARGERVRQWRLEARRRDGQWREAARGESIGHKRIARFEPVVADAVRLSIDRAAGEVTLRRLAVYA